MADDVTMEVTRESLRAFNSTLFAWQVQSGKTFSEVLHKSGRLLCVAMAYGTQPFGDSPAARDIGRRAVERDIGRVYVTISKIYNLIDAQKPSAAKGFFRAVRTGDLTKAREIMHAFGLLDYEHLPIGPFDPGIHDKLRFRNSRGRISKGQKPRLIVTDPRMLAAYQKRMADRVGRAKSSWATCADHLGGSRGIPQWAKRWRAPGSVQDLSKQDNNPRIIITSHVKYIDVVLPEAEREKALAKTRGVMLSDMRRALEYTARRARLAA